MQFCHPKSEIHKVSIHLSRVKTEFNLGGVSEIEWGCQLDLIYLINLKQILLVSD